MEILNYFLLAAVGAIAGFININAGGGSSLTLPALIFMGLDGATANGTNRLAIFIQNIFAIESFRKKKHHQFKLSFHLALFTLPGAVAGAFLATRISDLLFQRILAVVLIFIVISLFSTSSYRSQLDSSQKKNPWIYPAMLGIGFYGGFIQVGVGFILMAALFHLLEKNLVRVNMHKVFIVLIYMFPALGIFLITGNIEWGYGLALAAGNAIGGWWGAHAAVKGGEKLIRKILAAAVLIMAFKLFNLF